MVTDITQSLLRSILVNQDVGTTISSRKFKKLNIWKDELIPYLEKLQNMGYIEDFRKSMCIKFKIIKPISLNTLSNL